ncbi:MAG TPA: DUF4157 domain-containing protein [Kofleriaceae bacterium]|nr:DUF4157 domain-containing protein [Kofleriaceae bacterium]
MGFTLSGASDRSIPAEIAAGAAVPGKRTQIDAARAGLTGAGDRLPHADRIAAAFGPHDVSDVRAQVGGAAAGACASLGAVAYAHDGAVAFAGQPDLHTAAHEAAHVVQQRGGVQCKGATGEAGDAHERHADAVADAVVNGLSAASLLDEVAPRGGARGHVDAVQLLRFDAAGAVAPAGAADTTNSNAFHTWVTQRLTQPNGAAAITAIRDHLRGMRDAHDPQFTHTEAIALSIAERALDDVPFANPHGGPARGDATFADLPRKDRWRMFVDVAQHGNGALAFDAQSSPGYYAAMMRSFDTYLDGAHQMRQNGDEERVDATLYREMHDRVTDGAFTRTNNGFANLPQPWSGAGTNYPMAIGGQHQVDPAALAELRQEGVACVAPGHGPMQGALAPLGQTLAHGVAPNPAAFGVHYGYQDLRAQPGGIERVAAVTQYGNGQAEQFAETKLAAYYTEVDAIDGVLHGIQVPQLQAEARAIQPFGALPADRASLERICRPRRIVQAIARAIRALHVGHVFPDANGRLNTMLLLNRLLIERGLSPSIVNDTSVFGGRASLASLTRDIEQGQDRFQDVVQQVNPMHDVDMGAA